MDVCLVVALPDRSFEFLQQPIECLYTATILRGAGHRARVVDLRIDKDPEKLPSDLSTSDLFVVLTQAYDLTQCYSISVRNSRRTVEAIRARFPGVPVVAAGMHASTQPEMTVAALGVDAALPGELEAAVPWLVTRLAADPDTLSGGLSDAPREVDPATLPVPDYSLVDVSAYYGEVITSDHRAVRHDTTGLLFANRGCPYSCSYCFVWFGPKIRTRRPEQVVAEMRAQIAVGVDNFFFLDYTFTISKPWVRELCALIRAEGLRVSWVCQTRCERVDPELLAEMHAAGCNGIYYGVESPWISELALEKPTPRPLIDKAIADTAATGIHPFLFIILGLENNDPDKASQLHDWLAELPGTFLTSELLPRPFTALWAKHTAGTPAPASWDEYAEVAARLQVTEFTTPAVTAAHERIKQLPNYIGNRV